MLNYFKFIFSWIKIAIGNLPHQFFLLLAWLYGKWAFKFRNNIKIIGKENVPDSTNILFLSNHLTLIDSFLIGQGLFGMRDLFFAPSRIPWNSPDKKNFFRKGFFWKIFRLVKTIPVTRGLQGRKVLDDQMERFSVCLKKSNLLMFFEGTRSLDGSIGKCKSGVSEVIRTVRPKYIVPIFLDGIQNIMPIEKGFNFFKLSRGQKGALKVGKPIEISRLATFMDQKNMSNKEIRQKIGDFIRQTVVELKISYQETGDA